MNFTDTKALLAKIAVIDNRKVDQATVLVWEEIVAPFTPAEMSSALIEYRRTHGNRDYLTPGDLVLIVNERREQHALRNTGTSHKELVWSHDEQRYVKLGVGAVLASNVVQMKPVER